MDLHCSNDLALLDPYCDCVSGSKSIEIGKNYNSFLYLRSSVADPDPPDPHVFGSPGSGSTGQRYRMDPDPDPAPDPDPSIIMQK
jgi:hypothetical protein